MSLLKNSFYNTIAGGIRVGLVLLTVPTLIRLLEIKDYGLWSLASAVVELVALSGNGIPITTTVFGSRDLSQENPEESLSKTLTVITVTTFLAATLASIALWTGAELIVTFFPQLEPEQTLVTVQALKIGALVIWARLILQIPIGIEQAYQSYGLLNLLNTLQYLLLGLGLLIVAWRGGKTVELMQ
jgi:O-antigen/teichoic acid export membrane protein